VAFNDTLNYSDEKAADLVALDDALTELAAFDERKARTIELRYFGGLNADESAETLGVSAVTIGRETRYAEAWLRRKLLKRACWPPVWLVKRSMRRPSLSCWRVINGCSSGKPPFPRIAGRLWKRREGGLSGSTRIGASRKSRPPGGKRSRLAGLSPDS